MRQKSKHATSRRQEKAGRPGSAAIARAMAGAEAAGALSSAEDGVLRMKYGLGVDARGDVVDMGESIPQARLAELGVFRTDEGRAFLKKLHIVNRLKKNVAST